MNIFLRIISTFLAFLLMSGPATNTNPLQAGVENDNISSQENTGTVSQLLPQPDSYPTCLKKANREYFCSVNESTTLDKIIRDIGPADCITGSGISTYHWNLDDGSVANVAFHIDHILTLIIVKDGEISEKIIW